MKKIIKNPIFTFILGGIISSGVAVLAVNVIATNVTYKNTTVGAALDDLYTKATTYTKLGTETNITANKILSGNSAYNSNGTLITGSIATYTPTAVTPSKISQTIETNGKYINGNITINPIPSTYKNLTTNTSVDPSYLLSGETAYKKDGTLVTGSLSPDCVKGTIVCGSGCAGSAGQVMNGINFDPTVLEFYGQTSNDSFSYTYNKYSNSTLGMVYGSNAINENGTNYTEIRRIDYNFTYANNRLKIKNCGQTCNGYTYTYIACK